MKGTSKDMEESQSGGKKPAQVRKGKGLLRKMMTLCGLSVNLSRPPSEILSMLC